MPGFRKGKVPMAMLEKAYGKGVFYEDALNDLFPATVEAAVAESGIDAASAPYDANVVEIGDNGVETVRNDDSCYAFSFCVTDTSFDVPGVKACSDCCKNNQCKCFFQHVRCESYLYAFSSISHPVSVEIYGIIQLATLMCPW